MAREGNGYKYEFKMHMEGVVVPFQSAMIMNTPNGVEMNIEMHPSDKIFDLKPKILITVFYKDWVGTDRKWRLMGEGEFSGFAKYDDASGARSISMVCRDFRMAIRKTPAVMVYEPDKDDLFNQNLYTFYGLKHRMILNSKDVQKKSKQTKQQDNSKTDTTASSQTQQSSTNPYLNSLNYAQDVQNQNSSPTPQSNATSNTKRPEVSVNTATRKWGGELNLFSFITNLISGTAVGQPQGYYIKGNNGRFMLDAFARGIWTEAVAGTNYATFINSRIRADKRMLIPENKAGYRFFNDKYLNSFGGEVIAGGNAFSSVESVIMRMAAIFQAQPYSCSTPNLIASNDAMSDELNNFLVKQNSMSFRYPYVMNSCMLLPPMNFTAPPNCNIIFPCMYSKVTWQHDYDTDVTRAWYRKVNIFDGESDGEQLTKDMLDVPNTLLNDKTNGYDNPPITIEERYKGITSVFGQIESKLAAKCTGDAFLERVLANPGKYASTLNKIFKSTDVTTILNQIKDSSDVDSDDITKKRDYLEKRLKNAGIKVNRPSTSDVVDRHAVFKFLGSRFNGRVISVDGDFNPYIVSGFPGAVLADDNRKGYKTLRTLVGTVQMVKHTISATGMANTSIVLNNVRFINEPTDMDDMGNPIFVSATDKKKARVSFQNAGELGVIYNNPNYFPSEGAPMFKIKNVMASDKLYDYKPSKEVSLDPSTGRPVQFAKDVLMVSKEGFLKGKSNYCFMDPIYMPNQIPFFYQKVFGQKASDHFMMGRDGDYRFAYDSIHEALNNLSSSGLKDDYEAAIAFVSRPVITEEDYFVKVLGASFKRANPKNRGKKIMEDIYSCNADSLPYRIQEDEWYGRPNRELDIPTFTTQAKWKEYYSESYCKDVAEGKFSSIYEKKPKTPFSKERRESVDAYRQEALTYVNSAR